MSCLALRVCHFAALVMVLSASARGQEPRWPRELTQQDGSTVTIYQPQVDEWQGYGKLKGRAAVTIQVPGQDQPIIGSVELAADTDTDHESRVVMVNNVRIVRAHFPGENEARAQVFTRAVGAAFPSKGLEVPLDRILANLKRQQLLAKEVQVSNKPPKIFVSRRPAVLVVLDGKPLLEAIPGTDLEAVLNTSSDLFHHKQTSRYYLLEDDQWLMAEELTGAWVGAGQLPSGFDRLPGEERWTEVRKHVPAKAVTGGDVPVVYVSEEPAELIVTLGEPQLKPIPGTQLLYVTNTEDDIFLCGTDGKYYTLISGRWFRSLGKDMPVEFCTNDLPSDFRNIPEDHTCGRVLVSVPGTEQAQEAVYAAQIPRQAKVERDKVSVEVSYTGEPAFELIEGTKVERAVNTSFDVFRVNGRYYVCYQAVWFESATPKGPWAVCEKVPEDIYKIPSTSDKYHVTYVQVFNSTPDYVVYGYYPGYYGCYVWGGVVLYGCGYYWHHNHAYWHHCHHHWHHHPAHHTYGRGHYYDHLDGRFRSHRDAVRRTGAGVASGPYQAWGKGVTPSHVRRAPVAKGVAPRPAAAPGRGPRPGAGDLHVGADGGVYRRQGDGWQRYEKGSWQQVRAQPGPRPAQPGISRPGAERPGAERPGAERPGVERPKTTRQPRQPERSSQRQSTLNRSYRSRSQGSRRPAQYRNYRSSRGTRTSGASRGGMRGGGRGGRGR